MGLMKILKSSKLDEHEKQRRRSTYSWKV